MREIFSKVYPSFLTNISNVLFLFLFARVAYSCMVYSHEPFLEYVLYRVNILEGQWAQAKFLVGHA